jgi:hypothetical protein
MTESEYEDNLRWLMGQVDTAIESFYIGQEIHQIVREQTPFFERLNRDAAFWNSVLHNLQSTLFTALWHIFDVGGDTPSIDKLLSVTVEHPEYFSKTALRTRKIAHAHETTDWREGYIESAWEPTASDLRALKKATAPFTAKFEAMYRPFRNKVFGHNMIADSVPTYELFRKPEIQEIDDILYFLCDLTHVLFDLFVNGNKPELGRNKYRYKQRIRDSVQSVLSIVYPESWTCSYLM